MANRSSVRVVLDKQALEQILTTDQARAATQVAGDAFADRVRARAAKNTGRGAASIKAVIVDNYGVGGSAFAALVSWDQLHWYMKFPEFGTKFFPAQPSLQPTLDEYAQF